MDGPTNQEQGIIEIAWLMGLQNTVGNVQPDFQEYSGTDTTMGPPDGPPDILFVVHLHVDHVLNDLNGNSFLGIYALTALVSDHLSLAF